MNEALVAALSPQLLLQDFAQEDALAAAIVVALPQADFILEQEELLAASVALEPQEDFFEALDAMSLQQLLPSAWISFEALTSVGEVDALSEPHAVADAPHAPTMLQSDLPVIVA
jgi:hypothetical protein